MKKYIANSTCAELSEGPNSTVFSIRNMSYVKFNLTKGLQMQGSNLGKFLEPKKLIGLRKNR
jgi:hypothetical protein